MRIKKYILLITCCYLLACNSTNADKKEAAQKETVITYLKTQFKVDPQIHRFDTTFLNELQKTGQSMEIDSLISSRIKIIPYQALQLNFIEYNNAFEYVDKTRTDFFSINFIQNTITGKFYFDYINDKAGSKDEDWCLFERINNTLQEKDKGELNVDRNDIAAYNSVNSLRTYGDFEIYQNPRKTGIELYLNDVYRFNKPSAITMDSLFYFYDRNGYRTNTDTLMKIPDDLYKFLTNETYRIKSQNNYGGEKQKLIYLKDQIALLLLKTAGLSDGNKFLWVYKEDNKLRIRSLLIKGNFKAGCTYFIDEHSICF